MKTETVEAMLEDMRKITMLTGEISSVHQESLQKWPYIVFDDVEGVEVKYDLTKATMESAGQNLVEFFIAMPKGHEEKGVIDRFDDRCRNLVSWVWQMFWSDIEVRVFVNNVKRYSMFKPEKEKKDGLE
jgi:hypothetical protein